MNIILLYHSVLHDWLSYLAGWGKGIASKLRVTPTIHLNFSLTNNLTHHNFKETNSNFILAWQIYSKSIPLNIIRTCILLIITFLISSNLKAQYTAVISPTLACSTSCPQLYTLTIVVVNGPIQSIIVTLPTPISNVSFTSTTSTPFIQQSLTSTELRLYAQGGGAKELQNGDNLTITFNSCIISTGTFTVSAFQTSTYTSPRTLSGSQPTVTAKTITAGGPDNICEPTTPSAFTLSGANFGGSAISAAWSITNLSPANGGLNGSLSNTSQTSSPSTITYTPPSNYQGTITLTLTTDATGPCGAVSSTRILTVNSIPIITGSTPASRCGTGTLTLGATSSAGTINWYSASTGGSSLGTGTSFTTPSLSTTTTYYVDATLNGCTTTARTAVIATVAGASDLWIGGTVGSLTDWNTDSNWSCGVPTATTDVTIPSGLTYYPVIGAANGTCRTITDMVGGSISGTGSLTIVGNGGVAITNISGTATISCPVVMPATASVAIAGNLTISGVVSGATTRLTIIGGSGSKLTLSGSNTYSGSTYLTNNSSVYISSATAFGSGPIDLPVHNGIYLTANITASNNITDFGGQLESNSSDAIWAGSITTNSANPPTLYGNSGSKLTVSGIVTLSSQTLSVTGPGPIVISGKVTGTNSIYLSGGGTLTLSGANDFSGGILDNNRQLNINNAAALGTGTFSTYLNSGLIDNTSGSAITITTHNQINLDNNITFRGTNSLNLGTGAVTLYATPSISVDNNILTIGGVISGFNNGGFGITKAGAGTLLLSGVNTYSGTTTVNAGILQIGVANSISTSSNMILTGGTFSTGTAAGYNETVGTLTLSGNASIQLGTGRHDLHFGASNGTSWSSGKILTINGWTGLPGQTGTAGRIYFGGSNTALTAAQLAEIKFTGYTGIPILLSTGEMVPASAAVLAITGTPTDFGSLCIGTPSAPITYTITNTNATANGVAVTSSNPQFVVSSLSSTTIIGDGGTATFVVTFTLTSSGIQSATITVTSAISNSPTITLTGTGLALPVSPTPVNNSRCGTGTVTLSATPAAGETIDWYAASSGGTPLLSGNVSYTTPSISATTIYYAEARNSTTGCKSASRTSVTATVNAIPTITLTTPASRCGTGTLTIGATASAGTINWYDALSGGSLLGTGTSFTTPSLTSTTTYYAEASDIGCVSATRTAVTATVNTPPIITTIPDQTDCKANVVEFTAVYSASGTVNYQWKSSTNGGTSWSDITGASGSSSSSPIILSLSNIGVSGLNVNQTFYQIIISDANGCSTTSNSALLTVNSITSITGSTTSTLCEGQSISFTASTAGVAPLSFQWVKHTSPGTWSDVPGATTQTLNFANISLAEAGEYKVRAIFPITIPNNNNSTTCTETNDNITRILVVNPLSTATAGGPDTNCQSATPSAITLIGASIGGSATTGEWSITNLTPANGGVNGTLSPLGPTASPETVTYTPPANYAGIVTLTLTSNGPCGPVTATRIITINPLPTTSAIYHR